MKFICKLMLAFALLTEAAAAQSIAITPRFQEKLNWDWSAIAQLVLDNYGVYVSQTAIAAWSTPSEPNAGVQLFGDLTGRTSVATTLNHFGGIAYQTYTRALTLAEITTLISGGHLIVAQTPAGKYLVYGVSGNSLLLFCPWPGLGGTIIRDYATFVTGAGYPWTESLVLTSLPGTRPTRPIDESTVPRTMGIFGFDKVWVNDGVYFYSAPAPQITYGQVGSSWSSSLSNTSGTYGVTLGANVKVGNLFSSGPVFARSGASMTENVYMNNIAQYSQQDGATIGGTLTQLTIPYMGFSSGTIDFTGVSQTTVGIEPDQPLRTMTPGKYWGYNIKARSPVKFTAGDYYFHDLSCDACSIQIDASAGPVRIYVANSMLWTGATTFVGGAPERLMLAYLGTNAIYINGQLDGTVLAPNADLIIGQTYKYYIGMYIGKTVTVHQTTIVRTRPFTFE